MKESNIEAQRFSHSEIVTITNMEMEEVYTTIPPLEAGKRIIFKIQDIGDNECWRFTWVGVRRHYCVL